MSSTKRASTSPYGENYETPRWAVHRLLEELDLPVGLWLEPSAGNGQIIRAVNEDRPGQIIWHANELRTECLPKLRALRSTALDMRVYNEDFLTLNCRDLAAAEGRDVRNESYYDVAILNPPFSLSVPILSKCLAVAAHVVMLQRNNWIAAPKGDKRVLLTGCMPDELHLPDRVRFLIDGKFPKYPADYKNKKLRGKTMPGDSIEYTWYYWPPSPLRFRRTGGSRLLLPTPVEYRTHLEVQEEAA